MNKMMLFHYFSILMVFIILPKDMVTAQNPDHCSFIAENVFKLSVFDLEDGQTKKNLYLDVTHIKNDTVGEFLDRLEKVERIHLSAHVASVRTWNEAKDAPHFTFIPPMTPLCRAIDVKHLSDFPYQLYTFFVGAELSPQQVLQRKFLKGLIIDSNTGLLKMGTLPLVSVDKSYRPAQELLTHNIDFDEHTIETVQTSVQSAVPDNISALIISVPTEISKQKKTRPTGSIKTKSAVVSLLNQKVQLLVDESRIEIDPPLIKRLYNTIENSKLSDLQRTEHIVKFFNKFGWYVPNNFVIGARLDVVKTLRESSVNQVNSELAHLSRQLKAAYEAYDSQYGSRSAAGHSFFTSNERITSTAGQATDIPSFMENVQNEENWTIIAVKNILPTCKLLLKEHSSLFSSIRRLFIENAHHQQIVNLQPNLDILKYVNIIWSEYIVPF